MAKDPEQKSKIRAEVAIAAAALALAVIAYLRPPDPAHPVRFDFLSRTISLPLWVAGIVGLGIVATTAIVLRGRWNGAKHLPGDAPTAIVAKRVHESHPPTPPFSISSIPEAEGDGLEDSSDDDVTLLAQVEEHGDTKGIMLRIRNDRLSAVAQIRILIPTAQSFDGRHQAFRDGMEFKGTTVSQPNPIGASCSGSPVWLVAKKKSLPELFVGDTTSNVLHWPENDVSNFQKWRLSVSVTARTVPQNSSEEAMPIQPIKMLIDIGWNKMENEFSLARAEFLH